MGTMDTMNNTINKTFDLGNNESVSVGVFQEDDGTFIVLSRTRSRAFKTRAGAERWLRRTIPGFYS